MSKFTVDSFIVELGFNENVIKGLQRVEKAALQSAQRIERNLNRAFKVDTKQLDSNLTASLKSMEGKINKTFDKIEQRASNTKAFQFTTTDFMTLLILQNNQSQKELLVTEQSQQLIQLICLS